MKSIIFLAILITIYYQVNKRYPEKLTNKNHIYFGIFCAIYVTIIYLLKYQKIFVYRVFKSIKEVDEKPLYDINSVIYKENQMILTSPSNSKKKEPRTSWTKMLEFIKQQRKLLQQRQQQKLSDRALFLP